MLLRAEVLKLASCHLYSSSSLVHTDSEHVFMWRLNNHFFILLICVVIIISLFSLPSKALGNHFRTTSNHIRAMSSTSTTVQTLLLKHPGTCTGMFWRGDPLTNAKPPSNDNWPRNGALLQGTGPISVGGEDYFKVSAIQQAGTTGFSPVPEGTYMLYDQGGRLLHEVK